MPIPARVIPVRRSHSSQPSTQNRTQEESRDAGPILPTASLAVAAPKALRPRSVHVRVIGHISNAQDLGEIGGMNLLHEHFPEVLFTRPEDIVDRGWQRAPRVLLDLALELP